MDRPYDIRRIEVIDDATVAMLRRMSPGQSIRAGLRLLSVAKRMAEAGIRYDHPDWSDEQVRGEVLKRIARGTG